jgi:Tfp pilus assembly protein PilF
VADIQTRLQQAFALHRTGSLAEAGSLYRAILAEDPRNVDALHLLGLVLKSEGKMDEALASMRRAVELRPDFADGLYNLGNLHMGAGRTAEAIDCFRRAIRFKPELAEANYNLGNVLRDQGDLEGAEAAFRAAIAARPDYVEAVHNLANVLKSLNRVEAAIMQYRHAIALKPDLGEAHYNMGLVLMLIGAMEEGLEKYEWRWEVDGFPTPRRDFGKPRWTGEAIADKTLLIHAEQGLGDAIQFARYLPLIAGRARRIVLESRKPLMRLMETLPGVDQVVEVGHPLPPFDVQAPLLSLPYILKTRLHSIPGTVPYLRADPSAVAAWQARRDARFTVGLIWAGNRKPDPSRTTGLAALKPILDVPGIRFVGLQKELEPGDEALIAGLDGRLDWWGGAFADFTDTAAAMDAIDLVISIDTGPAHLAGALGRPTWVFIPFAADWRWLMAQPDSPWYPTMTLYRQEVRGDWTAEIARVAADLRRRVGG